MKLTPEEINKFDEKKKLLMLTYADIITILIVNHVELSKATRGVEADSEVVQAVREWIA